MDGQGPDLITPKFADIFAAVLTLIFIAASLIIRWLFKSHWALKDSAQPKDSDPCVAARVSSGFALFMLVCYLLGATYGILLVGTLPTELTAVLKQMLPSHSVGYSLLFAYSGLMATLLLTGKDLLRGLGKFFIDDQTKQEGVEADV